MQTKSIEVKHEADTKNTESRAARATTSAQDTTRPQALSIRTRSSLMALKASGLSVKFGGASFSLGPLTDPSSNTDPSQPCTKQSWNWTRSSPAASPISFSNCSLRNLRTMDSSFGHVDL
ncbi:hypothetical protein M5K25_020692 [Dendrobium thyrsiflorum]|uniref:Uncharacterized protein n=1 Tax=Dendrobium thyrsiflorum TaxID=117978 RepID=A0ABD0UAI7_DENTH